jgi:site-specific DNA-methyltransferase (adenine-specific)
MSVIVTKLEIDDWFKQLIDKIDLWITDPPYPFDTQNGTGRYQNMYTMLAWSSLGGIFKKMFENTDIGGRAYIFCNRDGLEKTKVLLAGAGWTFRNVLVWDKMNFGGGYHWRNQVEYIVYVTKGKPKTYVKGHSNIFSYKKPGKKSGIPGIGYDPTSCSSPKPWRIWEDIIKYGGCEGDICADPFAGSNPMKVALDMNLGLAKKIKTAHTNAYKV